MTSLRTVDNFRVRNCAATTSANAPARALSPRHHPGVARPRAFARRRHDAVGRRERRISVTVPILPAVGLAAICTDVGEPMSWSRKCGLSNGHNRDSLPAISATCGHPPPHEAHRHAPVVSPARRGVGEAQRCRRAAPLHSRLRKPGADRRQPDEGGGGAQNRANGGAIHRRRETVRSRSAKRLPDQRLMARPGPPAWPRAAPP